MSAPSQASSAEVYFAQKLAGNDKKIRDQGVRRLRKWFLARTNSRAAGFTEEDMLKIWKGLHYCMWMSDKPLVQEELADNLCSFMHSFGNLDASFMFIDTFYKTQCREWFGIDRLRLDKFMMLFRRFLGQSLTLVKRNGWKADHMERLSTILTTQIINGEFDSSPDGLKFHLADIFIDELTKVTADVLKSDKCLVFIQPWVTLLGSTKNKALVKHLIKRIFMEIVLQSELNPFEEDEEDEEEAVKEPKLDINYTDLADSLFKMASSQSCVGRNRKQIYQLVTKFRDLQQGRFPLEEVHVSSDEDLTKTDIDQAVKRLTQLDNATDTKKKRKRKRKKSGAPENHDEESADESHEPSAKKKKSGKDKENKASRNGTSPKAKVESKKSEKGKKNKIELSDKTLSAKKKSKNDTNSRQLPKDEVAIFSGGSWVDSDEDTSDVSVQKKSKASKSPVMDNSAAFEKSDKKKKNKKLVTLNGNSSLESQSGNSSKKSQSGNSSKKSQSGNSSKEEADKIPETVALNSIGSNKNKSMSKKKAAKSNSSAIFDVESWEGNDAANQGGNTSVNISNGESSKKSKKKKRKSEVMAEDINLFGNAKSTSESNAVETEQPKKAKRKSTGNKSAIATPENETNIENNTVTSAASPKLNLAQTFAKLEKVKATPPAFVRKAVSKATPKTEPKKKRMGDNKPTTPMSEPSLKKRVSFIMSKNTTQEFKKNTPLTSPATPLTLKAKPDQGILKSTPVSLKLKLKKGGTPASMKSKRAKAADFF